MHRYRLIGGKLLRVVPDHPALVVLCVFGIAFLALTQIVDLQTGAPRIEVDPSVESLLPAMDENRVFFDRFKEEFSTAGTIVLALEDDRIFTTANLARIQRISEAVESLPEVNRVNSLSLSINIRSNSDGLVVEPFYEEVPESEAGLAELRSRALADPIYSGNLISEDGRVSVIVIHLLDISDLELQASGIDAEVRAIAEREWSHAPFRMTGTAHVKTALNELIVSDMTVIVPITWALMAIVIYIAFRSVLAVVITLVSIQLAVLITIGLIAVQYGSLNQVTSAVPSILFVVGLAYAIHILAAYYEALRDLNARNDRESDPVLVALRNVVIPVLFTGFTTAAGFLSLTTSSLEAIQQYGFSIGFGVVVTMLVSLTFTPAALRLFPTPKNLREHRRDERIDRLLVSLAQFDIRHRNAILGTGLAVALFSLAGIFRIEIGYDFVSIFRSGHPIRTDFNEINSSLQGANAFNLVLETSVSDGFKEPENLAVIDSLQTWLSDQPEIGGSTSFADYIKALYKGIEGGDPAYFRIPESKDLVSQLLIVGANEEIERFVNFDFKKANIEVRTTAMNSRHVLPLVERIEARFAEIPLHIRARVTGETVLVSKTMDDIAFGQATSMLAAFGSIFLILSILFMSFRAGLVALIPNAIPVLMYFGILGWAGIELNTTTGMIACLVLGIAVDDTIHLFTHFNRGARRRADEKRGVTHALLTVGRPVTYTTVALVLGFLCLLFSEMRTQFEFGWLAAVTLAGAWVVDMTFTPALAARLRIVSLWDVITLDLGERPQDSIPLFSGLTENQARMAASLAKIEKYSSGARIFEANDRGNYIYVVIEGSIKVSVQSEKGEVLLNHLDRGAVFGEIALFSGIRSADVDAMTDVRLLRLGLEDFDRIQRRRPRVGAQLYANLSRVQAERMAKITRRVS